jgi:hypothetical protein
VGREQEEMEKNKEVGKNREIKKDNYTRVDEMSSDKAYSKNPDEKQGIWTEVLMMAADKDTGVRRRAADMIPRIFSEVKGSPGVFFDLIKLTESQDAQVRERAAELFPDAFESSGDKLKAWDELVRLASAEDRKVRRGAILALSSGYAEVPDKGKAWKDLVRLADHSDNFVKRVATRALGNAFFQAPDKTEAWKDLQALTANPYSYVRKYAFRSLGKASLWRSLRAENEVTYIFGIREAVKFFKGADEVSADAEIPDFYQPFYEALLSILFSGIPGIAKIESERFISKLTLEIKSLGESQHFFEILNQLAELLRNAGNLPSGDLSAKKNLLGTSIKTLNRFSYSLESKEEYVILTHKPVKKEHYKPGKEILDRVEKRKSFLSRKP